MSNPTMSNNVQRNYDANRASGYSKRTGLLGREG